jgi:hypothetical protein
MRAAVEARSHFFVRCHEYYIFFGTDFSKKEKGRNGILISQTCPYFLR